MMTVIGYTDPLKSRLANMIELVNEGFNLVFTYHMYTFTDWLADLELRKLIGKFLVYLSMLNIVLNIYVAVQPNILNIIWKIKVKFLRAKLLYYHK